MDQITIQKPNRKGRLFFTIGLKRDLAAGVYLPEPPPLCYTLYKYITFYLLTQGRRERRRSTIEKVRGALVHKRGRKY
jgi:hypothetical protein